MNSKPLRKSVRDFRRWGFDPYIAVEEQTLTGLKENIFRQLQAAEYFVFVDFKPKDSYRMGKSFLPQPSSRTGPCYRT